MIEWVGQRWKMLVAETRGGKILCGVSGEKWWLKGLGVV